LVALFEQLPPRQRTRRIAREYSITLGYKSISEVRCAVAFKKHGISYQYEDLKLQYRLPEQNYIPDFRIQFKDGYNIFIEYKGKFTPKDRRKLLSVKECNPTIDLRLWFERSTNKLSSKAKSTYGEWADKHGFLWYDRDTVEKLFTEILELEKKCERKTSKATKESVKV